MNFAALMGVMLQDDLGGAGGGLLAAFFGAYLIFILVLYAFSAFCFMKIAEKTNTENGWWAWIPILNILLMLAIAKKPMWWIILFIVPLVNIVIMILVLVEICKARGKPGWWAVWFFIPLANLIVLGVLAFSD